MMRYTKFLFILIFLFGILAIPGAENSISTDITGEVTTVYAVNFDYLCHGLDTLARVGVLINLHNTSGDESTAYGSVYGYLKIDNFDLFQYTTASYTSADSYAMAWEREPITNTTVTPLNGLNTGVFNPSLEAKLIMGKLYLRFDNGSSLSTERDLDAGVIPYLSVRGHDVTDMDGKQLAEPTGVLAAGYTNEWLQVEVKVASQAPGRFMQEAVANRINLYNGFAFGVEGLLMPLPALTVQLASYISLNYHDLVETEVHYVVGEDFFTIVNGDGTEPVEEAMLVNGVQVSGNPHFGEVIDNPLIAGVEVGYEMVLTSSLNLRPYIGAEMVKHNNPADTQENFIEFEAGGGVTLFPAGESGYIPQAAEPRRVELGDAFSDWTGVEENYAEVRGACLYVGYLGKIGEEGYEIPRGLNAKVTLYDDNSNNSLLRKVGLAGVVVANNILNENGNLNWGLGVFANTTYLDKITPFFYGDLWMGDYLDDGDNLLQLNLGAEFTFINNALLSCRYCTGNLLTLQEGEQKWGELLAQVKIEYK